MSEIGRIARFIVDDYYLGRFDLSQRGTVSSPASWPETPQVQCVDYLRESDVSDQTVRLYLTFVTAVDRGRDSAPCWWNALELFENHPEVFDPLGLFNISAAQLKELLNDGGICQGGEQDSQAWLDIAQTIAIESNCPVSRVIYGKSVDAKQLLKDLGTRGEGGRNRFPLLGGTKTSGRWIRSLAYLGGANITHLESLQITIDPYVVRATKNLGMIKKDRPDSESDTNYIQSVWRSAVDLMETEESDDIWNTGAAIDPALSFFSRYGCGYCDKTGRAVRLGRACNYCRLLL